MNKALITFVKAPVPGTVKTRLQADVGADKAVATYKTFVTGILSECAKLNGVDRFLGCAPDKKHPFLKDMAKTYDMPMFIQRGNSLGERIFNAFRYCAQKGYAEIVLIGSDSPSMPLHFMKKAFSELEKKDLVIGPCFDLGLYLIGVRREKIRDLSKSIQIDTGKDVTTILETARQMNIRFSMLPFWYDVDNIQGLNFLMAHLPYLKKKLPL